MHSTITFLDPAGIPPAGDPDLVLAFASRANLTDDLARRLAEAHPRATVVGCSTAGQFVDDELRDDAVAYTALTFDEATVTSSTAELADPADSREVGAKLGAALAAPQLRVVLVLSDGTACNGTALVEGLSSELSAEVVIVGGLAADGDAFETTSVLAEGRVRGGVVTAVGLSGPSLVVGTGSEGGWDRFGPERTITASDGAVLNELDGEPALGLYSRYLGDRAADLPGSALLFPLAIREPGSEPDSSVVRTILGIDHDAGSMTFAGTVPVGWKAQLMRANFDALVDGAELAAEALADTGGAGDMVCLGVSCVGRRLVLGQRTDEELDAVVSMLPGTAQFTGFYSYGELAPGQTGSCELHNQTMTLTLLSER